MNGFLFLLLFNSRKLLLTLGFCKCSATSATILSPRRAKWCSPPTPVKYMGKIKHGNGNVRKQEGKKGGNDFK